MNCVYCNKILIGQQKKYCSKNCKNLVYQKSIRLLYKETTGISLQTIKGVKLKYYFILQFGGRCSKCGYHKNISALEFHHIDSATKKFNLDSRAFSNRKIDDIKLELKKCIVICSNCHQEIHNPHLDIENIHKFISQ